MAEVRHLSSFDPHEVESIRATERKTLLADHMRSGQVEQFIAKHGTVLMAHSREGGYFHNAHPVDGFTSIILRVR